jgi:mRNA deadenylase 3'-5' endonuclease subunit Ccr4
MSSNPSQSTSPPPIDWSIYKPKCEFLDVPASTKTEFIDDRIISPPNDSQTVKILSWNILAQTLIRRNVFPSSSQLALKWGTRRENLFSEIQVYGADVLCLQELDFYDEFWKPRVVQNPKLNYGGGLWKRKDGNRGDGVAVIWNASMFELAEHLDLEYDDFCKQEPYANNGNGSDLSELLRGNVAQIVALRRRAHTENGSFDSTTNSTSSSNTMTTPSDEGIIIFNTHLFWNPNYNYVRLVQLIIALEQIVKFKERTGLKWPVVMCGDYNNSSGDPAYEALFERSRLTELWDRHLCWLAPKLHNSKYQAWIVPPSQDVLDAEDPKPKPPQSDSEKEARFAFVKTLLQRLEHLELPSPISIYRNYKEVDGENPDWEATNQPSRLEPPFTSYSSFWCGPLDYIGVLSPSQQVSKNDTCRLIPHKLLRMPRATELGPPSTAVNSKRIPNPVEFPNDVRASDHLPIMVSFSLQPLSPII